MVLTQYKHTLRASYLSYMTHAVVNNFAPLLFVTFQNTFGISLQQLGLLVSFNFTIQLIVDFLTAHFGDRLGYRRAMVIAHLLETLGLVGLGLLPDLFAAAFHNACYGLLLAILLYAAGGGLIEVLVSPIVEACPTEEKSASMSLLHSFYCWGHVLMVMISTLFFRIFGLSNWRILALLWAVIPFCNMFYFAVVPIRRLTEEGKSCPVRRLFRLPAVWLFFMLMLASGASEQAMSQWASAFAESGLHVSKSMGDLLGPCLFAAMMGLSRIVYAKNSARISLTKYIFGSSVLCILTYLVAVFAANPMVALIGCGLCGFAVGILWPGTISLASAGVPAGGTAFFAFLALGGDIGCALGPGYVGMISGWFHDSLKAGLLFAVVFPVLVIAGLFALRRPGKRGGKTEEARQGVLRTVRRRSGPFTRGD